MLEEVLKIAKSPFNSTEECQQAVLHPWSPRWLPALLVLEDFLASLIISFSQP